MDRKKIENTVNWIIDGVMVLIISLFLVATCDACSPKIVERVDMKIVYRDTVIHDTATFQVPVEVEKIVTRDTVSHLENTYAKSDAVVSGGFLSHSLESKPQIVKVPVEVHVRDTITETAQIVEKVVEVEKPLSWWQSFKMRTYWYFVGAFLVLFGIKYGKYIVKLVKLFV